MRTYDNRKKPKEKNKMTNTNREAGRNALDELVLFEGTLEELNAKDPSRQYEELKSSQYEMITADTFKAEVFHSIIRSHLESEKATGLVEYKIMEQTPIEGLRYFCGKKIRIEQEQSK